MKWRWMRCEISFFTENNEADLPSSLSTTVGWMPPEPETLTKSMEPPATDRKGRTPSKTPSTASSVMSGACVETMFYGAFVLNRCGDLHAIDATPARWRGAAGSSPLDGASTAASNVALVEGRHAELSQRLKEEGEKLCPTILH